MISAPFNFSSRSASLERKPRNHQKTANEVEKNEKNHSIQRAYNLPASVLSIAKKSHKKKWNRVFPGSLSKILELQPPEQPKQFSPKRPIIGGTRKKKAILPDFNTLRIKNIVVPTVAIQASTSRARSSTPTPRSYTLRVRPLHALDLYDPCSINKCTHDFLPRVKIQTNGQEHIQSAAHHARNHSVWVHSDMIFPIEKRNENLSINVTVWNFCQDTNTQFLIGEAGVSLSEIYEIKELSQFFPICRVHHDTQGIITRYITGKIKLRISIETEKELQESTDTSSHVKTETVEIKESPAILAAILAKDPPLETSAGNTEMDENKVPVVEEKAPTTPPSTHFRPQLPFSPIKFSGEDFSLNRRNLKAVAPLKTTSEVPVVDSCIRRSEWDPQVIAGLFAEIQEETKAYQIPQSRLKIYESIGEGVHASVKYAKLQLPVTTDSQEQQEVDVAVKEFRYSIHPPPPKVLECFRHEYRTLSALSHRNIVKYIGVSLDQPLAILTEFLQNGSLHKCINDPAQWNHVSIQKKLFIAHEIAQGLAFLHKNKLMHRDIKSHNILVTKLQEDKPIVKICDLGSAMAIPEDHRTMVEEVGSSGYTAPEIYQDQGYTEKVDVWSFGILLWEIFRPIEVSNPFIGLSPDEFLHQVIDLNLRPFIAPEYPQVVQEILTFCWQIDPTKRPSMDQIQVIL